LIAIFPLSAIPAGQLRVTLPMDTRPAAGWRY